MGQKNSKKLRRDSGVDSCVERDKDGEEVLGPPVGPRLIVVLEPETEDAIKKMLQSISQQPLTKGIVVERLEFKASSALAKNVVVSVQAPFQTLLKAAERKGIYKKIKASTYEKRNAKFTNTADELGLWRPFHMTQKQHFEEAENAEKFFTAAEILYLLCDILCASPANTSDSDGFPVLLEKAADGKLKVFSPTDAILKADVCASWASSLSLRGWLQPVPVEKVTTYFGPGVSLYFVFLQSYTKWLTAPALFGCILYLVRKYKGNDPTYSILQPCYALMIAIWSTVFITNWRHLVAINTSRLGNYCLGGESPTFNTAKFYTESYRRQHLTEESMKQSFARKRSATPLFGKNGLLQYIFVLFAMVVLLAVSVVVIGGLLNIGDRAASTYENVVLQNLPVVLYIVVVTVFEKVYDHLAVWLTSLEQHAVYKEYLRNITIKTSSFQLINYLGWFLYLAFYKNDMVELESQLFMFFTVKQVIGNITEILVPYVQKTCSHRKIKQDDEGNRRDSKCMTDEDKLKEAIELEWSREAIDISGDYLEIAVLFAAFTWFAPIFPHGALLALIHVVAEAAGDRWKMCHNCRRSVPQGTNMLLLEAWLDIFEVLNAIGIAISVACLFYSGTSWEMRHLIGVEHAILFCWFYLTTSMPKVPEWLSEYFGSVESEFPLQEWLGRKTEKEA